MGASEVYRANRHIRQCLSDGIMMEARRALLAVALHNIIEEPSIEAGWERVSALAGCTIDYAAFCDAVASCVREGLVYEPIRLPEGALQCHWHFELTPKGVAAAQTLTLDKSRQEGGTFG